MASSMVCKAEGREVILERVFSAPKELVFKVFSDGEHLKQWWGPRGWEVTVSNMDFRPGGAWHYCMKCMDPNQGDFYGMESWGKSVYQEIDEPDRIVYVDYFSDAEGTTSEGMPASTTTMTFEDQGGQTLLISRSVYESEEAVRQVLDMGMEQGITETWDRLEEYVSSWA
ncbi:SRPBCC family protein [Paenibacillus sp. JCM 10914]|uniref:SRPBCC domain-containing protein n=1 Tax=Paenibacillus sp. JCM 10914 TaxID=1236974 RepID=UPI0003CC4A2C|nr:SRPBCC domain-containing protein [Paenibacillus sp. JCM 10914]GAE06312.1 probable glutathione S-transferase-related transmembrane protein [Paenibacillus sp. JCM 10914]